VPELTGGVVEEKDIEHSGAVNRHAFGEGEKCQKAERW
jgi:hypothetical protein